MGLAFIDLMILLTEARGGRFEPGPDGRVCYQPSGQEPRLHVGSRRGVPYHAKTSYRLPGGPLGVPNFLTTHGVAAPLPAPAPLRFPRPLLPLSAQGVSWGYYPGLLPRHPHRTTH